MLTKYQRLVKEKDFANTFKRGRSHYGELIGVRALLNQLGFNRYGLVVSTKVSKKAVERNKLKRRLRQAARQFDKKTLAGHDLVITALPAALGQPYLAISGELEKAFLKLKLFK